MTEISSASQNSGRVKVMKVRSQRKQLEDAGGAAAGAESPVMRMRCSHSGP